MFRWFIGKAAYLFVCLGVFYGLLDLWGTFAGYGQIAWLITPTLDVLIFLSKVLVLTGVGVILEYAYEGKEKKKRKGTR